MAMNVLPPSLADLEEMAQQALTTIPEDLRRHVGNVVIRVEEFPDEDTEKAMELESPFDILGLYQGVALPFQTTGMQPNALDMIFLYRRPILDEWCERGDLTLGELVEHVLVHEIGHHFGLSDDDIEAIEAAADES